VYVEIFMQPVILLPGFLIYNLIEEKLVSDFSFVCVFWELKTEFKHIQSFMKTDQF
jgi:hypothetical protein